MIGSEISREAKGDSARWIHFLLPVSILLVALTGCATTATLDNEPRRDVVVVWQIEPLVNERVSLDQVVLVAEAPSGLRSERFDQQQHLLDLFVAMAPQGRYDIGLMVFGGGGRGRSVVQRPEPFDRAVMSNATRALASRGGGGLEQVIEEAAGVELMGEGNRAALVIFSDGDANRDGVIEACRNATENYNGELWIYTVQLGTDPTGRNLLDDMTQLASRGTINHAINLETPGGMDAFLRSIFFAVRGPAFGDADGDGVDDHLDLCPNTPPGVPVDAGGCPVDSDRDRVGDFEDESPDTPPGVEVDERGRPIDSDGDGVPDFMDECPNTPPGATVDARGCWFLANLTFDTNSDTIKPEFDVLIDQAARILNNNSQINVRVDGYTDSSGREEYNLALSERRAMAVRQALIDRGIADFRVGAQGFGEANPVAPNDTPENMRKNRRVEITVIE